MEEICDDLILGADQAFGFMHLRKLLTFSNVLAGAGNAKYSTELFGLVLLVKLVTYPHVKFCDSMLLIRNISPSVTMLLTILN
jgi:hypothetical protein